ncbi:Hypothetical Protein FCC1311_083592 [Hondaea fermentalgiana]|uniref:Uncharacterized protein n=1 Tax=Hondaea fermentalgiana TaxID=2315210 RepID=A0A2R5GW23_9STRA|nr:Hypothetical Protein FCC1311_083592 [Hondaea fermentalgiana]|eukprot:GBG32134.1 Hypothetical Protein FCC1311_083592 [Hondaea fermentalgiana]
MYAKFCAVLLLAVVLPGASAESIALRRHTQSVGEEPTNSEILALLQEIQQEIRSDNAELRGVLQNLDDKVMYIIENAELANETLPPGEWGDWNSTSPPTDTRVPTPSPTRAPNSKYGKWLEHETYCSAIDKMFTCRRFRHPDTNFKICKFFRGTCSAKLREPANDDPDDDGDDFDDDDDDDDNYE